jgi:hypothetical protein
MSKVDIKFIEIGVSFVILVVFIGLFALAKELPGLSSYTNIVYALIFLAFTIVISLWGMWLAPSLP